MSTDDVIKLRQYVLGLAGIIITGLGGWSVANTQALLVTTELTHKDLTFILNNIKKFDDYHVSYDDRLKHIENEQRIIKTLTLTNQKKIAICEINCKRSFDK